MSEKEMVVTPNPRFQPSAELGRSATYRRKGIARALLDAACTGLREQGMTIAEANPRPNAQTPADNHFGPLSLYLSSGFSVHREDEDGSVYVRRAL